MKKTNNKSKVESGDTWWMWGYLVDDIDAIGQLLAL